MAGIGVGLSLIYMASAADVRDEPWVGQLVVGQDADGRLEVFKIDDAGELCHRRQVVLYGDWSPWSSLGGVCLHGIAVGNNADGTLEVFAVDSRSGELKSIRQTTPNSANWGDWTIIGGRVLAPVTVGQNLDGRLEVFAVDRAKLSLRHVWQTDLQGGWSDWTDLGHAVRPGVAVGRNKDGRLELFGADAADGRLLHTYQTIPNGVNNWSPWGVHWTPLEGEMTVAGIAVGQNADGGLIVFSVKTNGAVSYVYQLMAPKISWSNWKNLGGRVRGPTVVAQNADGRLELFAVGLHSHTLFHCAQSDALSPAHWTKWEPLERESHSSPAVARNPDGTLEVFTLNPAHPNAVNRRRQLLDTHEWLPWSDLDYSTTAYLSRTWQSDDGLPFNDVLAIAQTRDGYLWLGTRAGLARFDGLQFTVFDSRNTPEMSNGAVTALLVDHEGVLWIGTRGGLLRLQGGVFSRVSHSESFCVNALRESRYGALWIGTTSGARIFRDGRFTAYTSQDGLPSDTVNSIEEDQDANIWLATSGGLVRWHDRIEQVFTTTNGLPDSAVHIVCRDGHGGLWLGSNHGLISYRHGKFFDYNAAHGLSDPFVSAICENQRAELWVGTFGGLNRFREARFFGEPTSDGLPYDKVNALFEDREGNLWIGSRDGLTRLTPRRCFTYTKHQGLSHNNVTSVREDGAGNLWIGTWGGGVNVWNRDFMKAYSTASGLPHDQILSLCEGRDGSFWLGADHGGGLARFKTNQFTHYSDKDGLPKAAIHVVQEDHAGLLWIGTSLGLSCFDGRTFTNYSDLCKPRRPGSNIIRAICEDHSNQLWFGSEGGLYRWDRGSFLAFNSLNGLSDDAILALYEDRDHNLWIGTARGGLNRYRDGQFTAYTTKQGLFSDDILSILEDDRGWLWMSCGRGIFRVRKRDFDALDQGFAKSLTSIAYGKSDGLESTLCNGIAQPAAWKSSDGSLWFATTKGLVAINPNFPSKRAPPPVFVEQVLADRRSLCSAASLPGSTPRENVLRAPPGDGELEFHFVALDLQAPEKTRFRYLLEGVDRDWVEAGPRRIAHYNNIYPGTYSFRVTACNSDGVWNETGATVSLFVQPHFWQTLWFRGLSALAILLAASGAARFITKRRMERKLVSLERQHAIEKERGRIAKDIHDDLGSSLTHIMLLGERACEDGSRPDELVSHARKIVNSARAAVQSLDEIVWAVNPENDTLDGLVGYISQYANAFFENTGINCRLEMPLNVSPVALPSEVRHDLFLTAKEALNNVLKHAKATELRLSISEIAGTLEIRVEDNGRGFDQAAAFRNGCGADGLRNMRRRVEDIGGSFSLDAAPGKGTRLKFTVQVSSLTA